jgi:exopolysaccharide production protein ExoQ
MSYGLHVRSAGKRSSGARESWLVTAFVVFLVAIMNIQIYSIVIALAIIGGFALYFTLYHRAMLAFVVANWAVVAYPLIVLLATAWSGTPSASGWYAAQFCVTAAIGVLIGVSATQRQMVSGVFMATTIVCVASLVSGRTGPSVVGPVLIGVTGSKDMMGFAGLTLMASGLGVLFDPRHRLAYRLAALVFVPIGGYIAMNVEAAAAMVGAIGFAVAFLCIYGLRYLGRIGRWGFIAALSLVVLPLTVVIGLSSGMASGDSVLRALNKDSTLTGRTLLWQRADQWIAQAPEFGHGYRSFWLGDSADRNGILRYFEQVDARGFQFHNTIREIRVETGWLGLIGFALGAAIFLYYAVIGALAKPGPATAFVAATYLLLLARAPIETITVPFSPYVVLFYACGTAAIVAFKRRSVRRAPGGGGRWGAAQSPGFVRAGY